MVINLSSIKLSRKKQSNADLYLLDFIFILIIFYTVRVRLALNG